MELPVDVEQLRVVLRGHGVRFALLFGSYADGSGGPDSDIDLATAPDGLAGRIALTGVVALDDDPVQRVRWQAQTRTRHLDELPARERFRRDFVAAHG